MESIHDRARTRRRAPAGAALRHNAEHGEAINRLSPQRLMNSGDIRISATMLRKRCWL